MLVCAMSVAPTAQNNLRDTSHEPNALMQSVCQSRSAGILQEIPELYRERFHNRNILIIDDNAEFGEYVRANLAKLYSGTVTFVSDPNEALKIINNPDADIKYDCLVLDVVMPKMWGTELIKKLVDYKPAVVLHTMSISNDAFTELCDQFGDFVIDQDLVVAHKEHVTRLQHSGIPSAPILRHHKGGDILTLVKKIDHAMLLNEVNPNGLDEFIQFYEPTLQQRNFSDEIIHNFSEYCILNSKKLLEIHTKLKEHELSEVIPKQDLLTQILAIANFTFRQLKGNSEKETAERMHDAVFQIASLPTLNEPLSQHSNAELTELLRSWNDYVSQLKKSTGQLLDTQRQIAQGSINLKDLICKIAENSTYGQIEWNRTEMDSQQIMLKDPDRQIEQILKELFQFFANRFDEKSNYRSCYISSISEAMRSDEDLARRSLLSTINAGDFLKITFYDRNATKIDKSLLPLAPRFAGLINSGMATYSVERSEDEHGIDNHFTFYIKLSEYSKQPLDRDIVEQNQDGSYRLNQDLYVKEIKDNSATYVILSSDNDFEIQNKNKPLYFSYRDYRILAIGDNSTHAEGALQILKFLAHVDINNSALRAYWNYYRNYPYVYNNGVRCEQSLGLLVDARTDSPEATDITKLLNLFSLVRGSVIFDYCLGERAKAYLDYEEPPIADVDL